MSKGKIEGVTVGELIDFLLKHQFSREDLVFIENTHGNEKTVKDIGRSVSFPERKLIICMR